MLEHTQRTTPPSLFPCLRQLVAACRDDNQIFSNLLPSRPWGLHGLGGSTAGDKCHGVRTAVRTPHRHGRQALSPYGGNRSGSTTRTTLLPHAMVTISPEASPACPSLVRDPLHVKHSVCAATNNKTTMANTIGRRNGRWRRRKGRLPSLIDVGGWGRGTQQGVRGVGDVRWGRARY